MGNIFGNKKLLVKKLTYNSYWPKKSSKNAAGFDLYSSDYYTIKPGSNQLIFTGLSFRFPKNTYGRIASRSGLALKSKVIVTGGVIDRDYTGNVGIILLNLGKEDYHVHLGQRIAQIIVERNEYCTLHPITRLKISERGKGGFGSTGI